MVGAIAEAEVVQAPCAEVLAGFAADGRVGNLLDRLENCQYVDQPSVEAMKTGDALADRRK